MIAILKRLWGYTQTQGALNTAALGALIVHVIAYSPIIGLSDYWFWIVNDIAVSGYVFCTASLIQHKVISRISWVAFSFSIGNIIEDMLGIGSQAHISEYIALLIAMALIFHRKKE